MSNEESFDKLEYWYEFYKTVKGEGNINGILIGNKSDKEHKVNNNKIEEFVKKYNLKYYETSAKLDIKIKKSIVSLLKKIINFKALKDNSYDSSGSISDDNSFKLDPKKLNEESWCNYICKNLNPFNWLNWLKTEKDIHN